MAGSRETFTFVLLSLASFAYAQRPSQCLTGGHTVLNQPHRSMGYVVEYPGVPLCDDGLQPGWYRFDSGAGGRMPENECPERRQCGTMVPIWLNGTHPAEADGIVSRQACANFRSSVPGATDCCQQRVTVGVANCGNFYIYFLVPTPSCPMAYCAGTVPPCPAGTWSPSGFEDTGCRTTFPNMTAHPVLSGPELQDGGHSFRFSCQIHHGTVDPEQRFEVAWTFDSVIDGNFTKVFPDNQRMAYLEGSALHGHMGKHVRCQARAFYDGNDQHPGPWLNSNSFHATIMIDPLNIEISQAMEERNISVTSTVPIVCNRESTFDETQCCIRLKLNVSGSGSDGNAIRTIGDPNNPCSYSLCSAHWNPTRQMAVVEIGLKATRSQLYDPGNPEKQLDVMFQRIPLLDAGPHAAVFQGFQIKSAKVTVRSEQSGHCQIYNDPRITSFDSTQEVYDLNDFQVLGDYTLFHNPTRHFEVQVRTYAHSGGYGTSVCAVAIREKDDLIRVDSCNEYYNHQTNINPKLLIPRKLSSRSKVVVESNGFYRIYLGSGAEIIARRNAYGMDITLTVPAMDHGHRGLCGTFDGNSRNELTARNGQTMGHSQRAEFIRSWKNEYNTSLFWYMPDEVEDTQAVDYCQCGRGSGATTYINCTTRGDIGPPLIPGTGTPVTTPITDPKCFLTSDGNSACSYWGDSPTGNNGKRSLEEHRFDFDEDLLPMYNPEEHQDSLKVGTPSWPTPNGVSEQQAEDLCMQNLRKSDLWQKLQDANPRRLDRLLRDCKSDIQLTDLTDFAKSYTRVVTTSAQLELSKDPSNFVTNAEGEVVLDPQVTTDLCDPDCLDNHGVRCDKGTCVCEPGFKGSNCQLDATKGPQIQLTRGIGVCDFNERPCKKIFFQASNLENSDQLTCKVQEVMPDGSLKSDSFFEAAHFLNPGKLACVFPDARVKSDRAVKTFAVRVTMDGTLYGNEVRVTVFDSLCQRCNNSGCQQLPHTCFIDNLCYIYGDLNPLDNTMRCDVAQSTSQWTSTLKYPVIDSVRLSLSANELRCQVDAPRANSSAHFQVMWSYDGLDIHARPLNMASDTASFIRSQLQNNGQTGEVACKVRAYYDSDYKSPYTTSNILDLAT